MAPTPHCLHVLPRAADRLSDLIQNPGGSNQADITDIVGALAKLPAHRKSRYGECHIAVKGEEVVEAFRYASGRKQNYDLICMDLMMPEMDGR